MASARKFRRARNWYLISKRSTNFLGAQWAGGVVLVIFAIAALVLANLDATKHAYHHILETDAGLHIGKLSFSLSIEQWVNDVLMVVFFFVVGLEIKREIVAGQLSSIKQASLPIAAALGGMIVPALIYFALNAGTDYEAGWGIPMATDIAFAIGILSLMGNKVPLSLKIFLTALAIVDDLGAILVIAIFYSSQIDFALLGLALAILGLLFWMNKRGVKAMVLYLIPAFIVGYAFLNSGVHSTIAGVLMAMTIPTKPRFSKKYFSYKNKYFLEEFRHYDHKGVEILSNENQFHALLKLRTIARASVSPAQRLEHFLHPFVAFLVMPVFALANAGVDLSMIGETGLLSGTQGSGIFLGLVVGKPVGIFLFCWLTIRFGLGVMPEKGTWPTLFGVACLGGIGFTMSIFIDNLAFAGTPYIASGKIAVLTASITAALLGALILNVVAKRHPADCEKAVGRKKPDGN